VYSQVTPPPVTPLTLSGASPSFQNSSLQAAGADPRSRDLAAALANLRDQAKTIRTPVALASDLLAEALLQRRPGLSPATPPPSEGEGLSPIPKAAPIPSPSPGVPPPSAPGGTASAAPAASSPAAGAAVAPPAPGLPAFQAAAVPSPAPTLVDALKAYVHGALAAAGRAPEQGQAQDPGSP
jgi:hypothetical protein